MQIEVEDAKDRLEELLDRVGAGELVELLLNGRAAVRMEPVREHSPVED